MLSNTPSRKLVAHPGRVLASYGTATDIRTGSINESVVPPPAHSRWGSASVSASVSAQDDAVGRRPLLVSAEDVSRLE